MNGAEPNNVSKEGIPVLLHACESSMDNEDMCLLLIQKGADPNSKQEVNTCMHRSINLIVFRIAGTPDIEFSPFGIHYVNSLPPLCPLGNFSCFFVVCRLFSKSTFSKNSFRNTVRESNSFVKNYKMLV